MQLSFWKDRQGSKCWTQVETDGHHNPTACMKICSIVGFTVIYRITEELTVSSEGDGQPATSICTSLHLRERERTLTLLVRQVLSVWLFRLPIGVAVWSVAWIQTSVSHHSNSSVVVLIDGVEVFPRCERHLTNQSFIGGVENGDVIFLCHSQKNSHEQHKTTNTSSCPGCSQSYRNNNS